MPFQSASGGAYEDDLANRAFEGSGGPQRGRVRPAPDLALLVTGDGAESSHPNRATYWPVAPIDLVVAAREPGEFASRTGRPSCPSRPIDVIVGAPILARVLIGSSRELASAGRRARHVSPGALFEIGAAPGSNAPISAGSGADVDRLVRRAGTAHAQIGHCAAPRLTRSPVTGTRADQREVRGFSLARLVWPIGAGRLRHPVAATSRSSRTPGSSSRTSSPTSSAIARATGRSSRPGLGYLALATSGDPALRQAARCERVYRRLRVLPAWTSTSSRIGKSAFQLFPLFLTSSFLRRRYSQSREAPGSGT